MKQNKAWTLGFYLLVFLVFLAFGFYQLDQVPFHGDESSWISSSNSFEAFIHFDSKNPVWNQSYWTLTQPPITRYLIGIGRTIGGYDDQHLNKPLDFFLSDEENIANGAIPEPGLLHWARVPMVFLLAGSFVLLAVVMKKTFGWVVSVIYIILSLLNPYYFYVLRLALGESPLVFFTCLAIVFTGLALNSWYKKDEPDKKRLRQMLLWITIASISIGLAAGSKINGGLAVLGIIVCYFILGNKEKNKKIKHWFSWGIPVLVSFVSFAVFTLINPFTYINPLQRALEMLMFRGNEINIQRTSFPEYQISGVWQHIKIDVINTFQNYTPIHFSGAWILNLTLFLLGIWFIVRVWRSEFSSNAWFLASLAIGLSVSLPSLLSPLNYPRYFLFPVIFSQMVIAYGLGKILLIVMDTIKKRKQPQPIG